MEDLAAIALEANNPRKTMRTAVRAIFYRIVGLYMLAIFFIGICISSKDVNLLNANKAGAGTAAESPFVIVIKGAGIKVLDHSKHFECLLIYLCSPPLLQQSSMLSFLPLHFPPAMSSCMLHLEPSSCWLSKVKPRDFSPKL